jgi:hypothetical protein
MVAGVIPSVLDVLFSHWKPSSRREKKRQFCWLLGEIGYFQERLNDISRKWVAVKQK